MQLCLGMAYVFIQRPDWDDAIPKCMHSLKQPRTARVLLTFLKVIAEEVHKWNIPFSDKLRRSAKQVTYGVWCLLYGVYDVAGIHIRMSMMCNVPCATEFGEVLVDNIEYVRCIF